jgi:hypothetical protein
LCQALAPPPRASLLLDAYQQAHTVKATQATAELAAAARAPSQTLTLASTIRARTETRYKETTVQPIAGEPATYYLPHVPGTIERTLHDLGITDRARLSRAAAIDHDSDKLIADALLDHSPQTRDRSKAPANAASLKRQPPEREP